ncbi:hypothetical protein [Myroides sp. N17-2]|uniref:hypothetical protein n=1 Tax=Myroides sp. N17-2 TaxID=2030799 RepID=UPI000EFD865D|nr:hypothetical protein [Myroides sp. N17-2]
MRKAYLLILMLLLVSTSSCVVNYNTVYLDKDELFQSSLDEDYSIVNIPAGSMVYLNTKQSKGGYYKIKYNNRKYWTKDFKFSFTPNYGKSSSYSSSSSSYSKPVQVKGYYRKNGSYVSPHTRSAPRRK